MNGAGTTLGRQVGEKFVRVCIGVVGLLILRGILSVMPVLRTEPVYFYSPSQADQSALLSQWAAQWPAYAQYGLTQAQLEQIFDQLRQAQQANTHLAPGDNGADFARAWAASLMALHVAIFPITIANAVVDTLIFLLLVLFGRELTFLFRSGYAKLPDMGLMLNLGLLTIVVALAYHSYQGVAFPLLGLDSAEIYGWVFLALGLAPLVGIAVVGARNMDALTAMVMRSGQPAYATASTRCGSCGQPVEWGTKFCPNCGAGMGAPAVAAHAATRKLCACGADNPATAKFCKGCGQPVAA